MPICKLAVLLTQDWKTQSDWSKLITLVQSSRQLFLPMIWIPFCNQRSPSTAFINVVRMLTLFYVCDVFNGFCCMLHVLQIYRRNVNTNRYELRYSVNHQPESVNSVETVSTGSYQLLTVDRGQQIPEVLTCYLSTGFYRGWAGVVIIIILFSSWIYFRNFEDLRPKMCSFLKETLNLKRINPTTMY